MTSSILSKPSKTTAEATVLVHGMFVRERLDYHLFGMRMYNRNSNSSSYSYSFQGQEHDDEIKGEGNSINYKFRMHDPRVGRFFTVDPMSKTFPHNSPYAFSENRVIDAIELEGAEAKIIVYQQNENGSHTRTELNRSDYTYVQWQSLQSVFMILGETAAWTNEKNKREYSQNPIFEQSDGTYIAPTDGTLYTVFSNEGEVSMSYDDNPTGEPQTKATDINYGELYSSFSNTYRGKKFNNTVASSIAAGSLLLGGVGVVAAGGELTFLSGASLLIDADQLLGGDNGSLSSNLISDSKTNGMISLVKAGISGSNRFSSILDIGKNGLNLTNALNFSINTEETVNNLIEAEESFNEDNNN